MDILESIRTALEAIWLNKLRSALTMLGIIIGVAAVITVVAIGQGGRWAIMSNLESMGTNVFMVYPTSQNASTPLTVQDLLTLEDVETIRNIVPTVKNISPNLYSSVTIQYGKDKQRATLMGTGPDFKNIRNLSILEGRFFNEVEDAGKRRVAIINEEAARYFFKGDTPLGKQIYIMSTPFMVIGVMKNENSSLFEQGDPPKQVIVPVTSAMIISPRNGIQIEAQAASKDEVQSAIDQTIKILEKRHKNSNKYRGISLEQEIASANNILNIMSLIIGAIAGISLLVGGIGVMNIMLVSVTERTREIGIRMSLGARRKDILRQFLIESVVICLVGGIIGTLLGVGGGVVVALIAKWPPLITPGTIFIAFFFSAGIGIFFGIYPANKASKLDPIEALRYE